MAKKRKRIATRFPANENRTEQSPGQNRTPRQIVLAHARMGVALPTGPSQFADISSLDFQRSRDLVADLNSEFEELPGAIRAALHNDPANYLDYMQANVAKIDEEGLDVVLADLIDADVPEATAPLSEGEQRLADMAPATPEPNEGTDPAS